MKEVRMIFLFWVSVFLLLWLSTLYSNGEISLIVASAILALSMSAYIWEKDVSRSAVLIFAVDFIYAILIVLVYDFLWQMLG